MVTEKIFKRAKEYIAQEHDAQFRGEIEALLAHSAELKNEEELNDRFYTDLEFGTGGLRGIIGGGFNRMNRFIVERATQGLATHTLHAGKRNAQGKCTAVIACDSRRYSKEFSLQAALTLAANGISTYLFDGLRPTPMLSFAVRELGTSIGIVVTASHNPPQYNGYKVYWEDGSQIVSPHDTAIIEAIANTGTDIKRIDEKTARAQGLLITLDDTIEQKYTHMVIERSLQKNIFKTTSNREAPVIVYTPLHGAGGHWMEHIMKKLELDIIPVPEQRAPDGEFPTVSFPNPEEESAMTMALQLGAEKKADIVIGNDPDADRIGIAVPDNNGTLQLITGNQHGALLFDYMLGTLAHAGKLPPHPAVIKTIVTTELQRKIASYYKVECHDTLTGFKNIAAKVREFEQSTPSPHYILGGEESYGFMIGLEARDKDGIAAGVMSIEMVLHWRSQGKTLLDRLEELYHQFGYYEEYTVSKNFTGEHGKTLMTQMMEQLREYPPITFAGVRVRAIRDVLLGDEINLEEGTSNTDIGLPPSNVIQFFLRDETVISIRPSGTEPKIKFYISCCGPASADLQKDEVHTRVHRIAADLEKIMEGTL